MRILIFSGALSPSPHRSGYMADVTIAASRRGHSVRFIAVDRGYEDQSSRFSRPKAVGGLRIVRLSWPAFGKRSFLTRILGHISFTRQGFIRELSGPRPNVILMSMTPPVEVIAALRTSTGWLAATDDLARTKKTTILARAG